MLLKPPPHGSPGPTQRLQPECSQESDVQHWLFVPAPHLTPGPTQFLHVPCSQDNPVQQMELEPPPHCEPGPTQRLQPECSHERDVQHMLLVSGPHLTPGPTHALHVSDGWSQMRPAAQPVDSEQGAPAVVPTVCMDAAGEIETSAATSAAEAATRSDTIVETKKGGRGKNLSEGRGRCRRLPAAGRGGCDGVGEALRAAAAVRSWWGDRVGRRTAGWRL